MRETREREVGAGLGSGFERRKEKGVGAWATRLERGGRRAEEEMQENGEENIN